MPSGSHDINVKLLALMGIVSAILLVALIVATQAWFRYEFAQENQRKYVDVPYAQLVSLNEAQAAKLNRVVKTGQVDGKEVAVTVIQWGMDQAIKQQDAGQ